MKQPNEEIREAIVPVLKKAGTLTTHQLAVEVGKRMKLPPIYAATKPFQSRVYRVAVSLTSCVDSFKQTQPNGRVSPAWRLK
jgi:hypothetical protein